MARTTPGSWSCRTTSSRGRRSREHLPIADDVLELGITPNRPDCLAVFGVAREVHAATGADLAEDPTAGDAEPQGDDRVEEHASVEIADPEICLRFTARVFEDVKIGPSPPMAQAAAGGRGPALDLERRGHHQLRDAHLRPAAACVRPGQGARSADRGAQGAGGRADGDPRRRRAQLRPRHRARLRRRGPLGDRRHHGRADLRGL